MNTEPINGKWYWVYINDEWFPAMRDESAAGGWTNNDTWQDWSGDVKDWQLILEPGHKTPNAPNWKI